MTPHSTRKKHNSGTVTVATTAWAAISLLFPTLSLHSQQQVTPTTDRKAATTSLFAERLSTAALERTRRSVRYDPAYVVLDYPGGDVPADTGVCTDVVVRSYRTLGIDLQKLVHEDMRSHFSTYPKNWGLKRPDKNIDHRRVPNLQTFFKRHSSSLPLPHTNALTDSGSKHFLPGDLIAWDLNDSGLWHIGIVVAPHNQASTAVHFVHNIGQGPTLDKDPTQWTIVGHYRYHPAP